MIPHPTREGILSRVAALGGARSGREQDGGSSAALAGGRLLDESRVLAPAGAPAGDHRGGGGTEPTRLRMYFSSTIVLFGRSLSGGHRNDRRPGGRKRGWCWAAADNRISGRPGELQNRELEPGTELELPGPTDLSRRLSGSWELEGSL